MADARYNTREYRAERSRYAALIEREGAECQQGLHPDSSGTCVMANRIIQPGTPSYGWHLGHNDTGDRIIGPTHPDCNTKDGGQRLYQAPALTNSYGVVGE